MVFEQEQREYKFTDNTLISLEGDCLFVVLSHFALFSLKMYSTACFRCLKVGPVLEITLVYSVKM